MGHLTLGFKELNNNDCNRDMLIIKIYIPATGRG
jgi:hypothetical protein